MGRFLFPDEEYKSIFDIDFNDYYKRGFRGIVFDIDNTLVFHDAPADQKAAELIKDLKSTGFYVVVISNNHKIRVASFAEDLSVPYYYKAAKPRSGKYLEASYDSGIGADSFMAVGDQIFTDIWGANRAGFYSVLVGQLGKDEPFKVKLKRKLEKPILFLYRHLRRRNG